MLELILGGEATGKRYKTLEIKFAFEKLVCSAFCLFLLSEKIT